MENFEVIICIYSMDEFFFKKTIYVPYLKLVWKKKKKTFTKTNTQLGSRFQTPARPLLCWSLKSKKASTQSPAPHMEVIHPSIHSFLAPGCRGLKYHVHKKTEEQGKTIK
jgi:hypothetical protein